MGGFCSTHDYGDLPTDFSVEQLRSIDQRVESVRFDGVSPATELIQIEIRQLLRRILLRNRPVNIVFSAPPGTGVEEYCDTFSRLSTAAYQNKVDSKYTDNVASLRNARLQSLKNLENREALTVHTADFLKEAYLHLSATEPENQMRVYSFSAMDHMNAHVLASVDLNYLDPSAHTVMTMLGTFVWKLATSNYRPSETLFVYVRYPDKPYREAYQAYMNAVGSGLSDISLHDSSSSSTSLSSNISLTTDDHMTTEELVPELQKKDLERLGEHVMLTKQHMDKFYNDHEMIASYFTAVMSCEDRVLLSKDHGLFIARAVLSLVDYLQEKQQWGSTDLSRLKFLRESDWNSRRQIHIPLNLQAHNSIPLEKHAAQFKKNAPLPVTEHPRVRAIRETVPVVINQQQKTSSNQQKKNRDPRPVQIDQNKL